MKKGFTMIELIFVIVIIGILAAVAIPRLSATRDDAKIAKAASEVAMAISDFGSHYTSQGQFGKVKDMTNVKFVITVSGADVSADTTDMNSSTKIYYKVGSDKCLSFKGSVTDGNLTVTSESNTTSICKGLNTAVKDDEKIHHFGGSAVKF